MPMQSLCHARIALAMLSTVTLYSASPIARGDETAHDFPTHARVEYVQECIVKHGGQLSSLYQCSCVIDELAKRYSYDEYVEALTFFRNASLGGDRGGVFRDPDHAKKMASEFRTLEGEASKRCGLPE
jgi:hypothetical protein